MINENILVVASSMRAFQLFQKAQIRSVAIRLVPITDVRRLRGIDPYRTDIIVVDDGSGTEMFNEMMMYLHTRDTK